MDSILGSIKQLLGINSEDTNFDQEIIMHINSVFSILRQLGAGPNEEFSITSSNDNWDSYLSDSETSIVELIKSYIYLKVRLLFDPPQNSFLVKSIESQIEEFEWRLSIIFEPYTLTAEEEEEE
jgi:hypothetical protein